METYDPQITRCEFDKKESEEMRKYRIRSARLQAQERLQDMIYKAIDNSLYSKDDCFVFCYFGETELHKSPYEDGLMIKDFIYDFIIVNEKTWGQAKASADTYYYVIKKNCLSQGTAIVKQNMGFYQVPYKFLKFLQETSPLNFKKG